MSPTARNSPTTDRESSTGMRREGTAPQYGPSPRIFGAGDRCGTILRAAAMVFGEWPSPSTLSVAAQKRLQCGADTRSAGWSKAAAEFIAGRPRPYKRETGGSFAQEVVRSVHAAPFSWRR
jgi:hypothetical protein